MNDLNPNGTWKEDIERYYDEIYRYCRRRTENIAAAEDLTQDVFAVFCEQYQGIARGSVRKWLYTVARNRCVDYYRTRAKEIAYVEPQPPEDMDGEGSALICEDTYPSEEPDIAAAFADVLGALDEDELRLYHDWKTNKLSYTELAAKSGVSEGTVRKRVSRLKRKIMKIIDAIFHMIAWRL